LIACVISHDIDSRCTILTKRQKDEVRAPELWPELQPLTVRSP